MLEKKRQTSKKALCTFGVGQHVDYLAITRPFMQAYAERHGYDFIERCIPCPRPPSWSKVLLLLTLLDDYDEVLWIDADIVIVNGDHDIAATVPADKWHALALHTEFLGKSIGVSPNAGLWLVRQPLMRTLEDAWLMTEFIDHKWWEQAAMHKLLGYREIENDVVIEAESTPLRMHTHFLAPRWHSIDITNWDSNAYLMHVPALDKGTRLYYLNEWAKKADAALHIPLGEDAGSGLHGVSQ